MTLAATSADLVAPADVSVRYDASESGVTRRIRLGDQEVGRFRPLVGPPNADGAFADWWGSYIRGGKFLPDRAAKTLKIVDLFSSVGGLSLGALEAASAVGLRGVPLLAADVDERALQVYRANIRPRQFAPESVRGMLDFRVSGSGAEAEFAYKPEVLDERLSSLAGSVDLVLAGPPCQGHSSLNNHSRHEDPKNLLYLTVPAAAVALNARHVVIENVPNVVADRHGVVQTTIALMRAAGYKISQGVLAADRFGWPQTRKRFFLVASRDSAPLPLGTVARSLSRQPLPVSWLLNDLSDRALDDADIMNSVPRLSQENAMRVAWLHKNNEHNLPNAIRPDCHKNGTTYSATYGRMFADQPAPTITGGFLTPGRGRFIHPTQHRVLTPREAARIQGFPDWFDFSANPATPPSRTEVSRWIGNAVPSILGFAATLAALGGDFETIGSAPAT
ncbi:DNA cytosine methyltransferase [Dietzia kunjamensis]|uniref:DNA cytosine methyltransferase n=1 Tax=Dietzia kunjamensis TaxID=322509 RepID=UPI003B969440